MTELENLKASQRSASRWTWIGLGLAGLAVALMLAVALVPGRQQTGDGVGENDAGVAHPQPVGVDDDEAPSSTP